MAPGEASAVKSIDIEVAVTVQAKQVRDRTVNDGRIEETAQTPNGVPTHYGRGPRRRQRSGDLRDHLAAHSIGLGTYTCSFLIAARTHLANDPGQHRDQGNELVCI